MKTKGILPTPLPEETKINTEDSLDSSKSGGGTALYISKLELTNLYTPCICFPTSC